MARQQTSRPSTIRCSVSRVLGSEPAPQGVVQSCKEITAERQRHRPLRFDHCAFVWRSKHRRSPRLGARGWSKQVHLVQSRLLRNCWLWTDQSRNGKFVKLLWQPPYGALHRGQQQSSPVDVSCYDKGSALVYLQVWQTATDTFLLHHLDQCEVWQANFTPLLAQYSVSQHRIKVKDFVVQAGHEAVYQITCATSQDSQELSHRLQQAGKLKREKVRRRTSHLVQTACKTADYRLGSNPAFTAETDHAMLCLIVQCWLVACDATSMWKCAC